MRARAGVTALTAVVALAGDALAGGGVGKGVVFLDPVGDTSPVAVAATPVLGDGALDLARVALRVVEGELRVAVTTHGDPALRSFVGYDVTAASDGRCSGTVFDRGFPAEFRVRAGADGGGTMIVKACSARLVLPVRVSGRTVEGRVPLTALPEVRGTTLFGIKAVAGLTDWPDQGTMRVHVDDAATRARLLVR